MKRLIPLWITALGGFVLIVAYFIPFAQGWGEVAAIWFDIMAAIAFLLGGGNLLKIHFKKVSDRNAGWGYSLLTIASFLIMLAVGLGKVGSPPAPNGEHYGEAFADLPVESIPDALVAAVPGSIPGGVDSLHYSVREQMGESNGNITFRGWMRSGQRSTLLEHKDQLEWRCAVMQLYATSQPEAGGPLRPGSSALVAIYSEHASLAVTGRMSDEQRDALVAMGGDASWQAAVTKLHAATQVVTSVPATAPAVIADRLDDLPKNVTYDTGGTLSVTGPMTGGQQSALLELFPIARPLDERGRASFLAQLGDVAPEQVVAFDAVIAGQWTADTWRGQLDAAGEPAEEERSPCELREEQLLGNVEHLEPMKTVGESSPLNQAQIALLNGFVNNRDMKVDELYGQLTQAGTLTRTQDAKFWQLVTDAPTVGERGQTIALAMLKAKNADGRRLPLTDEQTNLLLDPFRGQMEWRASVSDAFVAAHVVRFPWSGEYRAQGAPFWWLYEYMFKPLQATIFAMLAFYVASAAFRAFRAKNIEAILLLGTAFIILLGRTFAGVYLTQWLPEALSGLKIDNLTVYIMQVFNTAGNRAIMIGIALGIASTSLKVLLGVDRSYLGSGEE